jgi:hypothetical protein
MSEIVLISQVHYHVRLPLATRALEQDSAANKSGFPQLF